MKGQKLNLSPQKYLFGKKRARYYRWQVENFSYLETATMLIPRQPQSANHIREPMWMLDQGKRRNQILKARYFQGRTNNPREWEEEEGTQEGSQKVDMGHGANTLVEHCCPFWSYILSFMSLGRPCELKVLQTEQTVRACFQSIYFHLFYFISIHLLIFIYIHISRKQMLKIFGTRKSVINRVCSYLICPAYLNKWKWYPIKKSHNRIIKWG